MNSIKVLSVDCFDNKFQVAYQIAQEQEKYFSELRAFEVEYSEDISSVPTSILVIPFVCNVLPIIWLTDAVLELPELDLEFYEAIPNVLEGYRNMSPMLTFKGEVKDDKLVNNSYKPTEKVAALFSGGVDAFATLVAHAEEKPTLITLWGADVKLTDEEGWARVKQHTQETAHQYSLPAPLLVRTNFRSIIKEGPLGALVAASGDGWWHGYQHGIGILGHAAPAAYLHRWKTVYIASSFTPDNKTICASDPTIDNELRLVSTGVWHDQFDFHRQQKVEHIVSHCRAIGAPPMLRVCWIITGGTNCCVCEKCQRTIFALLAEGENPADYGFPEWRNGIKGTKSWTPRHCRHTPRRRKVYAQIQERFLQTQAYKDDPAINWFYKVNFYQTPTCMDRLFNLYTKTKCFLRKIKRIFKAYH